MEIKLYELKNSKNSRIVSCCGVDDRIKRFA